MENDWESCGGVNGPDGAVSHYRMTPHGDKDAVIIFGSKERPGASPMLVSDLRRHLSVNYNIEEPRGGWRTPHSMSNDERKKLRPIAETLAMLDGNAFFGMEGAHQEPWWWGYLAEADALYEANGGDAGWAGRASFGPCHAD